MLDPSTASDQGLPLTCRAVFIVGPDKKLKLSLNYPASVGRNMDELVRVMKALQLSAKQSVVCPGCSSHRSPRPCSLCSLCTALLCRLCRAWAGLLVRVIIEGCQCGTLSGLAMHRKRSAVGKLLSSVPCDEKRRSLRHSSHAAMLMGCRQPQPTGPTTTWARSTRGGPSCCPL